MPELTIEAAIIELNRLKTQNRMNIDRERMNAAIDKLIEAARYRIPRKRKIGDINGAFCPNCGGQEFDDFCGECGQAIDWGDCT